LQILARRAGLGHPDPEAAFGVMFVSAAAREAVLFGDRRLNLSPVRGCQLVRELVRAYCAYLGARSRSSPGRRRVLDWPRTFS
jgi:hypothetical protein